MTIGITEREARSRGNTGVRSGLEIFDFLGANRARDTSRPQAFLVDLITPGYVIQPHYHEVSQFQVVVRGNGHLGKHTLVVGAIHYADAYTPYGPITAGQHGMAFFTLRTRADVGAHYMPHSRGEKRGRKTGRNLACTVDLGGIVSASAVRSLADHPDGLGIFEVRAPAHTSLPGVGSALGGAYFVVLHGTVEFAGATYRECSCLFVEPQQEMPELISGTEAVTVVAMKFPTP